MKNQLLLEVVLEVFERIKAGRGILTEVERGVIEKFIGYIGKKDNLYGSTHKEARQVVIDFLKNCRNQAIVAESFKALQKFLRLSNIEPHPMEGLPKPAVSEDERQLELLKAIQREPVTLENLSDYLYVSTRTVEKDLTALNTGQTLFGRIKIDVTRKNNQVAYECSIHPLFLPLTLTEVVVLMKALDQPESPASSYLKSIRKKISCQLTDYAKEKLQFHDIDTAFSNSLNQIPFIEEKRLAAESLKSEIMYYCKSSEEVQITAKVGEEELTYQGRFIGLPEIKEGQEYFATLQSKKETLEFKLNQISSVKPLKAK